MHSNWLRDGAQSPYQTHSNVTTPPKLVVNPGSHVNVAVSPKVLLLVDPPLYEYNPLELKHREKIVQRS